MKRLLSVFITTVIFFSFTVGIDFSAMAATTEIIGGGSKADAVAVNFGTEYGVSFGGNGTKWFKFTTKSTDDYWYNITVKNITVGNNNGFAGICGVICDSFEEQFAYAGAYGGKSACDGAKLESKVTYYIQVWSCRAGTLKFQLDYAYDKYEETMTQAKSIEIGENNSSTIDSPADLSEDRTGNNFDGDVDYFKFYSDKMSKVKITLKNSDIAYYNTYFEGVVAKVTDAYNQVYAYVEVRPNEEESFEFEIEKNTTYFIKLFSSSGGVGTYDFCIECVHEYGATIIDPTYRENGSITEYCLNCDYVFVYNIPKLQGYNIWVNDELGWYYLDSDGNVVVNNWVQDSTGWCYLGSDGYMVTNQWIMDSVGWCYVGADGYCLTNCWIADSVGWCYLNSEGRMATNQWIMDSVGWCYVGADGYCLTNCWMADSIGWCYLDAEGRMVTDDWVKDSYGWCYLDANGYWDGIYY